MKQKQSKTILTNADLDAIAGLLDKQTAVLATKQELKEEIDTQTVELKTYIHEGIEIVMDGMDSLEKRLDVRDRVQKLEVDVAKLKLAH